MAEEMGGSPRHPGEQAVQRRAGEGHEDWGSPMFGPTIPPGFDDFLRDQRMLVIGAVDDAMAVWTTVITGPPGFVDPVDAYTVRIDGLPAPGDPLRDAFEVEREVGTIAIEPQTRRRIRLNGRARRQDGHLLVAMDQVLGNCPKYLQTRDMVAEEPQRVAAAGQPRRGTELTGEDQEQIAAADTFFIASHAPGHGADASHRGGMPGFVTVHGPRRLSWPDYFGNSFYMTLGNLQLNPACGLLFLDWESGDTLHLTGRGHIDWDEQRAAALPGALRLVEFEVDAVVRVPGASPLRWALYRYSRFNPPAAGTGGG